MPQWMRDFLCGLDWHTGTWAYDKGPLECSQQLSPSELRDELAQEAAEAVWERRSGTWAYDKGLTRRRGNPPRSLECSQTRICLRCGEKSSRIEHAVVHWTSNGWSSFTESGFCIRCKRRQTQSRGSD